MAPIKLVHTTMELPKNDAMIGEATISTAIISAPATKAAISKAQFFTTFPPLKDLIQKAAVSSTDERDIGAAGRSAHHDLHRGGLPLHHRERPLRRRDPPRPGRSPRRPRHRGLPHAARREMLSPAGHRRRPRPLRIA